MSMLLHHESVGDVTAVPIVVLHGIFGSGGNWRSFFRQLVALRPEYRAVMTDLRMHGRSQDLIGPHSLAAAAQDVVELISELCTESEQPVVVFGHSFGGKVAALVRERLSPLQTWIVDAAPGPKEDALASAENLAVRGLALMESLPESFDSREAFIEHVAGEGFSPAIAQWLATNVERRGDSYAFRLRADAMKDLLTSYYQTDLWEGLSRAEHGQVEYVVAGHDSALSDEELERLRLLPLVSTTVIHGAGHWIHVDQPAALRDLVVARLPQLR